MSSETSKVKTTGSRARLAAGSRRQTLRSATLRRLSLDVLETRTLMAVLPPTVFDTTNPNNGTSAFQTLGAAQVAADGNGNDSSPSIAVDQNDPQKLVATWVDNDPKLAPGPTEIVEFAFSTDGGVTWNNGNELGPNAPDPTTSNPQVSFAQATDASVAFDRNNNFYILWSEHEATNAAGELRLQKFSFFGATPTALFATPTNVYEWTNDQALNPSLAVDSSVASFTDTNASGSLVSQNDPDAGNVYVSWASVDVRPADETANGFNPNRIEIAASSDGGQTFSSASILNSEGNFGNEREAVPQTVVSQGRPAGTNGPGDPGVTPGQVTTVWDDYGTFAQPGANPPEDAITTNTITSGTYTQTFPNAGGVIQEGIAPPSGTVDTPSVTNFPVTVNITDPRFFSLTNLTATVALTDSNLAELQLVLIPPTGSNLQPITLLGNQVNAAGTNLGIFTGSGGANLGVLNGQAVGTTFDDNATRSIIDVNAAGNGRGAAAPYIGHFQAEGGSLDANYAGAIAGAPNSPNSVNGTWVLQITDFRSGVQGNLVDWSLNLTSGLSPNQENIVDLTPVRALQSGAQTAAGVDPQQGIAAAPVIASDNTLGAFSSTEGNLYIAYVTRSLATGTPTDNTDIELAVSTDGGQTWQPSFLPVNDDISTEDGFSEGQGDIATGGESGRAQFDPAIAVDQATGTLVMSWLDGRNDASRTRVDTYTTTSIDGGQTFSPDVYANDSQIATDAITGNIVNLGPIADNASAPSSSGIAGDVGFGSKMGLAVYGGQLFPIWSDDQNGGGNNKETLGIFTNVGYYADGPRVLSSTLGPVGQPGDTVNDDRAPDGTPIASSFIVTFDRPIDPNTFGTSDAQVFYHDTTQGNLTGGLVPVTSVVPLDNGQFGATTFQVNFAPRTGVGTYSLEITSADISDRIRTTSTQTTPSGSPQTVDAATVLPSAYPAVVAAGTFANLSIPATALPAGEVLSNVTVTLHITDANDTSLSLTLIAPDGTAVPIVTFRSNAFGANFTGTTFSSSDPNAIPLDFSFAPYVSPPNYQPASTLSVLNGKQIPLGSSWTLQVRTRNGGQAATINDWSVSYQPASSQEVTIPGNHLDQNVSALSTNAISAWPGAAGDFYASPMPISGMAPNLDQYGANVSSIPIPGTSPFTGPYLNGTLPLILPGPHVASTSIPGQPATSNNLVLNSTVSSIDVTFDRDMDPSSITPASILQVMGPAGQISGPYTVTPNPLGTDPDPSDPRTYRIGFPTQTISGTYTVTLASSISDAHGNALDSNLNAGLNLLQGTTGSASTPITYSAPATIRATPTSPPVANVPQPLKDGTTTISSIDVPDTYLAEGVTVQLSITHPFDPDLQVQLISPNNVAITLVPVGTGASGSHANFGTTTTGTVFSDSAATPIQNGGAPFFGSFKPATPLSTLNGSQVNGLWKLVIVDQSSNNDGLSGTLNSWSLTFQKALPSSGLGEQVADQANLSFQIFTFAATNPQSSNTWTAVGPASAANASVPAPTNAVTNAGFAGSATAIAVDPSDPSGNTVYVAAASGGIWKTTDFLTTNPSGPTYIPLTNFGPTFGMNIGSIAVFGRNSDPRQSIIIAGTGDGDTLGDSIGGNTSPGVGFLISQNGGATWSLLDSTNNNLPFASRDHAFAQSITPVVVVGSPAPIVTNTSGQGVSINKVVVDPNPEPNGNVIIYAAISGPAGSTVGGLWRSVDTGQTWTKVSTAAEGNATDVVLDLSSATVNALSNPTGNVNTIFAAFPGSGVYISPNRGSSLTLMAGGTIDPLIRDVTTSDRAVTVNNGANDPVGLPSGRIVLAKPTPPPATSTRGDVEDTLYEGWLYAAVTDTAGNTQIFLTKDFGQTWTQLKTGTLPNSNRFPVVANPSNDQNQGNYSVAGDNIFPHATYDIALAVDPTNPNILYVGGTANGNETGLIRIDATGVYDSHAEVSYSGSRNDGGSTTFNSTGRVALDTTNFGPPEYVGASTAVTLNPGPYLNLLADPNNPFLTGSTLDVFNTLSFTNDGEGVFWTPADEALLAGPDSLVPSSNIHQIVTFVDPTTGQARLLFADDNGVFTGQYTSDGTLETSIGNQPIASFSRNGNLQTAQLDYGASQPSNSVLTGQLNALFYGNGQGSGVTESDPTVLASGNTVGQTSTDGASEGFYSLSSADQNGVGIGVDQQGGNVIYRYLDTAYGGNGTDFFQVSTDGGQTWVSRTFGLVQQSPDPQWPGQNRTFGTGAGANAIPFGNFTVSPLNSNDVIISSAAGRIFATQDQGQIWLSIGEPSALDGSYADALTFGAPDPTAPGGIGNLNNFIYAGTVDGNIFVTQTGGGGGANGGWTNISTGLDGSPVVKIIADPARGTHDAYAVTQDGVYYLSNTIPSASNPTPTWVNITGNLFSLTTAPFGQANDAQPSLAYLTSIQADWRYVIPFPTTTGTGGTTVSGPTTHPILYVAGQGGVFQSLDNGTTWAPFPNEAINGSPVDGGYLPNVAITDLDTALGDIDPTTGFAETEPDDPDLLLATTFGQGQFAIRLAPLVVPTTLSLDTKLPAPNGSVSGTDAAGLPLVKVAQPVIDGLSELSGFGNTVYVTIYDLTNPNNPIVIGGFNPADGPISSNPTAKPANETNATGNFQVQVSPTGFTSNGVKTIGIQATDAAGTTGNIATLTFDLNAKLVSVSAPMTPTLGLSPASDSSGGQNVTNVTNPIVIGETDPLVQVQVTIVSVTNNGVTTTLNDALPPVFSDSNGDYRVQLPSETAGTYILKAVATGASGLTSTSLPFSFQILTVGPLTAPTLLLSSTSDTGVLGDNTTSDRLPVFTGQTAPLARVSLEASRNGVPIAPVLATATANSMGIYSIQLPNALFDGTITLQALATDTAGNAAPGPSAPLTVTIVSVSSDFTGTGRSTPAVFSRNANGTGTWVIQGVTSGSGVPFGSSTLDIPFTGDFDGDGIADKALYRPSVGDFFIARSSAGGETVPLGGPGGVPVVGNFFGSGITDPAVYNPATGMWQIADTTLGTQTLSFPTGSFTPEPGDIPVPGNYDNTGKDELAVYRPSNFTWYIDGPSGVHTLSFGGTGDIPVPGAYFATATNQATTEAVWRPGTGVYLIHTPTGGTKTVQFAVGDIPAPGDYDGTGVTEPAVYRASSASYLIANPASGMETMPIGKAGGIPLTAPLAYRNVVATVPSLSLSNGLPAGSDATTARQPVFTGITDAGAQVDLLDGNGNLLTTVTAGGNGVYQVQVPTALADGTYTFQTRAHGLVAAGGLLSQPITISVVTATADFTGAGVTQQALTRRVGTQLQWFVLNDPQINGRSFGAASTDIPLVGDFDGDGKDDLVTYTPSTGNWTIESPLTGYTPQVFLPGMGAGASGVYIPTVLTNFYGTGKDQAAAFETTTGKWIVEGQGAPIGPITPFVKGMVPVPGNYDNTGRDELAVYNPSTFDWYINGPTGAVARSGHLRGHRRYPRTG